MFLEGLAKEIILIFLFVLCAHDISYMTKVRQERLVVSTVGKWCSKTPVSSTSQ